MGFKTLITAALRRGLQRLVVRPSQRERYRTLAVDLGRLRIASIDCVGEALAAAEGEAFK